MAFSIEQKNDKDLLEINNHTTLSSGFAIRASNGEYFNLDKVYYISDIHLDYHIDRKLGLGADYDKRIECVKDIVHGLFVGDFYEDVLNTSRPVVLFLGDISYDFYLVKIFFEEFISYWHHINDIEYNRLSMEYEKILIRKQELEVQIEEEKLRLDKLKDEDLRKRTSSRSKKYTENPEIKLYEESLSKLREELSVYNRIEYKKEINQRWYESNKYKEIYVVLGNHEFWSFDSVDSCYDAYQELFDKLQIRFLNNRITNLGRFFEAKRESFTDDYYYEKYKLSLSNTLIVGGVGFTGFNPEFNANNGLYGNALDKSMDEKLTQKWSECYNRALNMAYENRWPLVVLTHNPISDWKKNGQEDVNCIYFHGHTHKNRIYHDEYNNFHIFADNQVGRAISDIKFKTAHLYHYSNPLAGFCDGCHKIGLNDYIRFNEYVGGDYIQGIRILKKQLAKNNAQLYAIKERGYYGFFIVSDSGTYICDGGKVRVINKKYDIEYIKNNFLLMVKKYIELFDPYRKALEEVSKVVKSFGGRGKIHGCIVDISFYSHIMISTYDGKLTYYYSPVWGHTTVYDNLLDLLDVHEPLLAGRYRELLSGECKDELITMGGNIGKDLQIDIKNSEYIISIKINKIHKLFDNNVLRSWDDSLLSRKTGIQKELSYVENG